MKTRHSLLLTAAVLLGIGAVAVVPRLRDLRDVRLPSTITSGHILSWNGTQWTNAIAYGTATNLADSLSATNLQLVTPKDFTATNITVATEVYDAGGWDGDNTVPTKDAVRDKIEAAAGDMTKAVYDTDADNLVDNAEGLTDSATVTNLSAKSVTVNSASDGIFMALRPTSGASNDAFQIQGAGNAKLGGWGSDGSLGSPSAVITNGLTAGSLTVNTNASILGDVSVAGTLTATNATLVTPTIASLANANHTHLDAAGGGTLTAPAIPTTLRDTTFTNVTATTVNATTVNANAGVFTNSLSITGTNGSYTLDDGADDSTFVMEGGADMAGNIRWNWSSTDTDDTLFGLDGTNVVGVAMIDVDSETQAGGTTMAVTFPTGPQYFRDVILSLTNSMVFTNTANAAAGRSVTYYIFPNAGTYTLNVDTDFKIVGGTFTQGMVATNRFVLTFKSLGTVDTNVWCSGNYVQ